jgi:Brp/Blh family beta-carotene 15,15'-monooxygenase
MIQRYPKLYRLLLVAGLLLAASGWVAPGALSVLAPGLAAVLILALGLPHGATDHLIFRQLAKPLWGSRQWTRFYAAYLGLMAGYGLVWWLSPYLALGVFIVLSVYHFGQGNWAYCERMDTASRYISALLWGSFAVGAPILLHMDEAAPIIYAILGHEIPLPDPGMASTGAWILLGANLLWTGYVKINGLISVRETLGEVLSLSVLMLAYLSLPMMLGFALFFSGWHALSSISDQIRFFKQNQPAFGLKNYIIQTLPLSLAATTGLGLLVYTGNFATNWAPLFIFISIVTLPHMVIIDRLYHDSVPDTHTIAG